MICWTLERFVGIDPNECVAAAGCDYGPPSLLLWALDRDDPDRWLGGSLDRGHLANCSAAVVCCNDRLSPFSASHSVVWLCLRRSWLDSLQECVCVCLLSSDRDPALISSVMASPAQCCHSVHVCLQCGCCWRKAPRCTACLAPTARPRFSRRPRESSLCSWNSDNQSVCCVARYLHAAHLPIVG